MPLQPRINAVEVIRTRRVTRLAGAVLAHQRFGLAEIDDEAHGRCQRGVEVLAPGERRRVQSGVIAAGREWTAYGLATGVFPFIAVQFAPLPGFVIAAQLTVACGDGRREAAGENRRFVFFLRRACVIPERAVFTPQQMIGLRRVGQLAVGDKGFPRRTAFRAQFVEEGLLGAFLQEQLVNRCIGGGRGEFAVERHQAGKRFVRLAAISYRQGFNGLLERLGHARRCKHLFQFGGERGGLIVLHGDHTARVVFAHAGQFSHALATLRCRPRIG